MYQEFIDKLIKQKNLQKESRFVALQLLELHKDAFKREYSPKLKNEKSF